MEEQPKSIFDPDLEVNKAANQFIDEYALNTPLNEYITMVGVTIRALHDYDTELAESAQRNIPHQFFRLFIGRGPRSLEQIRKDIIKNGEDPDEFCIVVGIRKPLPKNLSLPSFYKGFRVIQEIRGEAKLL